MGKPAYAVNVVGARISGIAARYAHLQRITADQALEEIRKVLKPLTEAQRRDALTYAAAGYLRPRQHDWWYGKAADVIERAGADMAEAQVRADEPRRFDLGSLGEQKI